MGFHEDDRIRNKNAAHNAAYNLFQDMRAKFWSNTDIINHAASVLEKNPDDRTMYELLKLAIKPIQEPIEQKPDYSAVSDHVPDPWAD